MTAENNGWPDAELEARIFMATGVKAEGESRLLVYRIAKLVRAREAAAWCAGRDAAADDADCGCVHRPQVIEHFDLGGERRARMFCPHGDACCAIQAASIRALTPPASFAAALEAVRREERERISAIISRRETDVFARVEGTRGGFTARHKAKLLRRLREEINGVQEKSRSPKPEASQAAAGRSGSQPQGAQRPNRLDACEEAEAEKLTAIRARGTEGGR